MANPHPLSYSAPSGGRLGGGLDVYPHASLDLIAAAPENSWVQLNANTYQDAWSPADSRWVTGNLGAESPQAIMRAWASVAWDSKRAQLVLYGGGHANSWSNEIYVWSAYTRQWEHAFFATDVVMAVGRSVDGNNVPVSCHTYATNFYLPILDRFGTLGGAEQPGGTTMRVWDGDTAVGFVGGFTLDMALQNQGFVAGSTGTNCKHGTYTGVDLPGAAAWKLRNFCDGRYEHLPSWYNASRIESGAAVAEIDGHDVLLAVIANCLFRIDFFDDDEANDTAFRLSDAESERHTNGACAYDPVRQLFVMPSGNTTAKRAHFVDLKSTVGPFAPWKTVLTYADETALGYLDAHHKYGGFAHYPPGDCFVYWHKGRQPFLIHPPAGDPTPTTGWAVTKPAMDTGTAAPLEDETATDMVGVCGKFRYAPELGCCLAVRNDNLGDVWALKLAGWVDPRV